MTTDDQRDAEMDRLLRSTLTPSQDSGALACPDPELLAAFGEGSLSSPERLAIEGHVAGCHRCQQTMAAFARIVPEPISSQASTRSWIHSGLLRWLVPVAAVSGIVLYIASRPVVAPSFLPAEGTRAELQGGSGAAGSTSAAVPADEVVAERSLESRRDRVAASLPRESAGGIAGSPASTTVGSSKAGQPPAVTIAAARPSSADRAMGGRSKSERVEVAAPSPAKAQTESEKRLAAANLGAQPAQPARPATGAGVDAPQQKPQGGAATEPVSPATVAPAAADRQAAAAAAAMAPAPPGAAAAGGALEVAVTQTKDAVADARAAAALRQTAFREPVLPFLVASPGGATSWRFERDGGISLSTDKGKSWMRQLPSGSAELRTASSPSALVCWAAGRSGVVLLTTDGMHWQARPFPIRIDLIDIAAASPLEAAVVTRDGRRFTTIDGGATWVPDR